MYPATDRSVIHRRGDTRCTGARADIRTARQLFERDISVFHSVIVETKRRHDYRRQHIQQHRNGQVGQSSTETGGKTNVVDEQHHSRAFELIL